MRSPAQFVPRGDDVRAKSVYDSPGIVVTGALAEYLLAMKVFVAREPDLQDIKHLAGMLGIDPTAGAWRCAAAARGAGKRRSLSLAKFHAPIG